MPSGMLNAYFEVIAGHGSLFYIPDLARLRTYPQHTCAWLPLLRSRPGGVHRRGVVRSPKSDNLSKTFSILNCRRRIVK